MLSLVKLSKKTAAMTWRKLPMWIQKPTIRLYLVPSSWNTTWFQILSHNLIHLCIYLMSSFVSRSWYCRMCQHMYPHRVYRALQPWEQEEVHSFSHVSTDSWFNSWAASGHIPGFLSEICTKYHGCKVCECYFLAFSAQTWFTGVVSCIIIFYFVYIALLL